MTDHVPPIIETLEVDQLYSNEEIFRCVGVSNAGGIRVSREGEAAVVMTSEPGLHGAAENPYRDRLEGGILTYTAAGKLGEQTLSGINSRIPLQKERNFPIHGFILIASRRDKNVGARRWRYLGLLEYLRSWPDLQMDAAGQVRKVWLFEFRVHRDPARCPLAMQRNIAEDVLTRSRRVAGQSADDDEILAGRSGEERAAEVGQVEAVRRSLLDMQPRAFELFLKDLLVHCGFHDVCVTKYSADGGIDVNARAAGRMWVFESIAVQMQAKRWLNPVGRREVAELRGSLRPFARGVILTTSYFSRAAIGEANEAGKNPIGLVDGPRLSRIVLEERFPL